MWANLEQCLGPDTQSLPDPEADHPESGTKSAIDCSVTSAVTSAIFCRGRRTIRDRCCRPQRRISPERRISDDTDQEGSTAGEVCQRPRIQYRSRYRSAR